MSKETYVYAKRDVKHVTDCFGVIEETYTYFKREEYICRMKNVNRSKERRICAEREVLIFQKKGTYVQKKRHTCFKGEGCTYTPKYMHPSP